MTDIKIERQINGHNHHFEIGINNPDLGIVIMRAIYYPSLSLNFYHVVI